MVDGRGVLGGWSAAELLGASCAPRLAPVELIVPGSSALSRPGLVVRADALTRECKITVGEIAAFAERFRGARGLAQLPEVLRRSSPLADSPMESRIRVAIEDAGLPMPVLQHRFGPYLLDLAYPEFQLVIEYDGREHLTPRRAHRDLRRQAYLSEAGWEVLRFLAKEVFQPVLVAGRVRAAILRRVARSIDLLLAQQIHDSRRGNSALVPV